MKTLEHLITESADQDRQMIIDLLREELARPEPHPSMVESLRAYLAYKH